MSRYNSPDTDRALDLLLAVVVTATCAKYGVPNPSSDPPTNTYADTEVLPGDLKQMTGLTRKDSVT